MHLSLSKVFNESHGIELRRAAGGGWALGLEFSTFILLNDSELDALKYAVDSAVFERDMGLDGAQ